MGGGRDTERQARGRTGERGLKERVMQRMERGVEGGGGLFFWGGGGGVVCPVGLSASQL